MKKEKNDTFIEDITQVSDEIYKNTDKCKKCFYFSSDLFNSFTEEEKKYIRKIYNIIREGNNYFVEEK